MKSSQSNLNLQSPSSYLARSYLIAFFTISCKILSKMVSIYFATFFYEFTKIKTMSFECPKSIRNNEENNAWNIRRLVDESFVPATHRNQYIIL